MQWIIEVYSLYGYSKLKKESEMDKTAIFNISYGLYVITTKKGEKDNGCIINTLMQICDNPLVGVISVNKSNYTHDEIMETKEVNISILDTDCQMDVFKRFGFQSGRDVNKFEGFENNKRSKNGIIYLTQHTNSYISAKVIGSQDFGSHTVFKIEMIDGEVLSKKPSLTYAYYHENIKPKAAPKSSGGWRCKICNYIHEDENLPNDFICPICKHGASDFEKA